MPDLKTIFCSKFAIKLFRVSVANADTVILKSLCTLFDMYLEHLLAKFELNRMVKNGQNFEVLDKTPSFVKPFLTQN